MLGISWVALLIFIANSLLRCVMILTGVLKTISFTDRCRKKTGEVTSADLDGHVFETYLPTQEFGRKLLGK